MKQLPKLTLVTKDDQQPEGGKPTVGFELVSPDDLSPADKIKVQERVAELLPKASLIAVARTPRAWDLRPVVTRAGENDPSIIRFVGPEIQRATHLNARVKETLQRLKGLKDLSSSMYSWGVFHGELWYRRPLVERTLAHVLSGENPLSTEQMLSIARGLVEEVNKWHERGVVHAHITSSNISFQPNGRVALLDAAIGLASIQARHGATEYNLRSFAPEVLDAEAVTFSADLYGLGLVYRRLFVSLSSRHQFDPKRDRIESALKPLHEMSNALLDDDPNRRPTLAQVRSSVAHAANRLRESSASNKANPRPKLAPGAVQGKILRSGGKKREEEAFFETSEPEVSRPKREAPSERPAPKPERRNAPAPQQEDRPARVEAPVAGVADPFLQPMYDDEPFERPAERVQPVQQPQQTPPQQPQPMYANASPMQPVAPHQGMFPPTGPQGMPQPGYPPQGFVPQHPGMVPVQQPYFVPNPAYFQPGQYAMPNQGQYAQPVYQAPPADQQPSKSTNAPANSSPGGFWMWMALCCVLLGGFYYYRVNGLSQLPMLASRESTEQLREDWNSRIPSRMQPVALSAVAGDNPNRAAQDVIVSSARMTDLSAAGVNVSLLRVAFNDAWEVELRDDDRRVALALALGGLLKQNVPSDLPTLEGLHPGVLFALVSNVPKNVAKNYFSSLPASRLAQLPPPYGPAFKQLSDARPGLSCGDESVQRLARLAVKGVDLDEVVQFLKDDPALHLRTLAMLYSQDNSRAQTVLEILLKEPNAVVTSDSIQWGRTFKLLDWKELEASDRLFLLAGVPPAGQLNGENIGNMFAHPVPAIRSFAISKAISLIKMEHPGAMSALQILQNDPQLLSPAQTIKLMKILVSPADQDVAVVRGWLESQPPLQIVVPLLMSTAGEKKGTQLDTALAIYLKGKHWKPGVELLRKLSTHPDSYTRLFAYGEIYLMDDRETARMFLKSAQAKESDEQNQQQLQQMLLDLEH
ncbi:MAG: hypothetical protein U0136_12290 [Bdellovibrionota bacterium]